MQYNTLLTRIAADIYSNGAELITGDILQNVLNEMVGALASAGACYKGTITPASAAPLDLDQPTVYLALTAGTYTNFVDSNNDPIVTTGPALITYDGGASLVFSKTDLPSGGSSATVIDTTGKNYLVFDWGAQNLGGSLLVTLKTSSGSRNRSLILDLDVYGDYVAKASDLDGAVELLNDTDFVYDNGTGVGYLTINSDVKGATLRLLSGTLPAISAESSAPEYYDPASVPVAPYGDGKWGVISQTQTWTNDYGTYTLSDVTYGAIPKEFIDRWNAAVVDFGGTFNESSGYFELNGLTDLSYQDALRIYNIKCAPCTASRVTDYIAPMSTALSSYNTFKARTVIPCVTTGTNMHRLTWNTYIEVTKFRISTTYASSFASPTNYVHGQYRLRKMLDVYSVTSALTLNLFYALQECYFIVSANVTASDSKYLSLASVVYMVENAVNTSAITITLHATAYARCQADTTEYTYQGNTYTGILALATAHNISIASA